MSKTLKVAKAPIQAPSQPHRSPSEQREATRAHRAINWVVSLILVVFGVWSINLNAEGRALFKQTTFMVNEMDAKIGGIVESLRDVKEACQQHATTVVVPAATVGNELVE